MKRTIPQQLFIFFTLFYTAHFNNFSKSLSSIYAIINWPLKQMATRNLRSLQKLFVGNLPWTVGHQELRSYFKEFGRVLSANVVFDKQTGCSKGYGFVTFSNISSLEKIENEPKHVLEGSYIKIQKA